MASILSALRKRVIKVRIQGNITQQLTDKIGQDFKKARFYIPEAVVVVINSAGGSLTQAKNISDVLRNYGAHYNIPIYCFAQDQCLGSANIILTTGVKCYTNQMTILGDFSYQWSSLWFKKFADKYNIKVDYIYSGENKVKFNPFEQIKPQSQKWMQNYLYALQHQLKCTVINHRQKTLTKKQMDKKQIDEKLFKNSLVEPDHAVQYGYIDGIMNADDLLNTTFSGASIFQVNKKDKLGKLKKIVSYAELAQ